MANVKCLHFLRLCPFCGGNALVHEREIFHRKFFYVKCSSCGSRSRSSGVGPALFPQFHDVSDAEAQDEVVSLWNHRFRGV